MFLMIGGPSAGTEILVLNPYAPGYEHPLQWEDAQIHGVWCK